MKILIDGRVLTHKITTGVQRASRQLINALSKENLNFAIEYPLGKNRFLQHIWEHTILPHKARYYDILFCPANISPIWIPQNTKLITIIHGLAYLKYPQSYNHLFRNYYKIFIPKTLHNSSAIITVSNSEKQNIIEHYPWVADKLYVVQNGVDDIFLNQETEPVKEKHILYIGSMNPLKNIQGLIEAFLKISRNIPHKLVIVGATSAIFKKNIVKNSERIVLKMYLNDIEIINLYKKAALFVFPSFYEASPFPPLEAMACGCPVLVSDIPALKERCGDAAEYCNPNNTDDIAKKIIGILNDKSKSNFLIEKGKCWVKKFTWEKSAKDIIKIFQQIKL